MIFPVRTRYAIKYAEKIEDLFTLGYNVDVLTSFGSWRVVRWVEVTKSYKLLPFQLKFLNLLRNRPKNTRYVMFWPRHHGKRSALEAQKKIDDNRTN